MYQIRKIVIKVGTSVLTKSNGSLDNEMIENIASQIASLKRKGVDVLLVSSGAVTAGKINLSQETIKKDKIKRQVYAAVGQVKLMQSYLASFEKYDLFCAQVLATKEDFRDSLHKKNMSNCIDALINDNIVPIINENDVISIEELMFTDNDELAGLVAATMNADALILLT